MLRAGVGDKNFRLFLRKILFNATFGETFNNRFRKITNTRIYDYGSA